MNRRLTGDFQYTSQDIIGQVLPIVESSDPLPDALPSDAPHRSYGFPIAPSLEWMEVLKRKRRHHVGKDGGTEEEEKASCREGWRY